MVYISKKLLLLCLIFATMACSKSDEGGDSIIKPDVDEYKSELIDVEVEAVAEAFENTDFSWQSNDNITLIYKRTEAKEYTLPEFTYSSSKKFSGQVWSWEEKKSIFAIYSRDNDISSLNFNNGSIEVSGDLLSSDDLSFRSNPLTAREAGLMVTKIDDATAKSDSDYSIPSIPFKQVAALLQLQFTDDLEDANVIKLELKPKSGQNANFIDQAKVSVSTGEIEGGVDKIVAITSEIENGESTSDKYLTLALLPVDISEELTLTLTADGVGDKEGWEWKYILDMPNGLTLERNNTTLFSSLSWSEDFTETIITSVASADDLADFANNATAPDGDTWIIKVPEESNPQEQEETLSNLSTILSNGKAKPSSVTVNLPGVTTIPENSFSGAGAGDTSKDNAALRVVILEDVTDVGAEAFKSNANVEEVVLGKSEDNSGNVDLSESTFEDCTALKSCQVKTEELPKSTFKRCHALRYVNLDGVKRLGESAFEECTSLFVKQDEIKSVSAYSRGEAQNSDLVELALTSVTDIESRAFFGCNQFEVIRLNEESNIKILSIANDAFSHQVDGKVVSYTPNIELYISGSMKNCVDTKLNTLTIGSTTLTFKKIFINGADDTDNNLGATGEDANIENM